MAKIKQKAYIPSVSEYDRAWHKFKAFMGAKLSEKAKKDGAWENKDYKAGYFFMRNPVSGSSYEVWYGDLGGTRDWCISHNDVAGLRVEFNLIYNPECSLVKGCKKETRTALVYENDNGGPAYDGNGCRKEVTSTAQIITLANGTKCLWLNKEECENPGDIMDLWTLDLVEKAEAFAPNCDHNDYGKADALRNQCENWVENNLSDEEKKMLVPVEMSDEDDYNKATPVLEDDQNNDEFVIAFAKAKEKFYKAKTMMDEALQELEILTQKKEKTMQQEKLEK